MRVDACCDERLSQSDGVTKERGMWDKELDAQEGKRRRERGRNVKAEEDEDEEDEDITKLSDYHSD